MSCNTCSKSFSFLRPEKGCPSCGFSYCSKCLCNKVFLQKINAEVKVCTKCKRTLNSDQPQKVQPPDAYYKRLGVTSNHANSNENESGNLTEVDQQIQQRLAKLKEDNITSVKVGTDDINARLQKLKGEMPSTSDAEIESRLANIRGVPISAVQSKPLLPVLDLRSEQEQADDLMKQYMAQANIDNKYKDEFEGLVSDIETRLQKLKGSSNMDHQKVVGDNNHSEDEEEIIKKIIEKATIEAVSEDNSISDAVVDELPFCEICNEDAKMRCLGCKYLFCKRCYLEHRDDDDGCNKYELYTPPKNIQT